MEMKRNKLVSLYVWIFIAGLFSQNMVIPVMSRSLADKKHYDSPNPNARSPPRGSHHKPAHRTGGVACRHSPTCGGYNAPPPTPSGGNCGSPPYVPIPRTPSTPRSPSHDPTPRPSTPRGGGYYSPPTPLVASPPPTRTPIVPSPTPRTPSRGPPSPRTPIEPSPPRQTPSVCPPSTPTPIVPSPPPSTPRTPPCSPPPSTPTSPGGGYYGPPTPIVPSPPPTSTTPTTPIVPSPPPTSTTPTTPIVPSPPPTSTTPTTPIVASPPPSTTTPPSGNIPGTPSSPGFPAPPFLPDPNQNPFTGTCNFWRNHPGLIWGLFGWWATLGGALGVTSLPGLNANLSLQEALSNTRGDGLGDLYREGIASLLNSMVNNNFPYTPGQVRERFISALSSNDAAASQAQLFRMANEGSLKSNP